jgi:hypothetical protein
MPIGLARPLARHTRLGSSPASGSEMCCCPPVHGNASQDKPRDAAWFNELRKARGGGSSQRFVAEAAVSSARINPLYATVTVSYPVGKVLFHASMQTGLIWASDAYFGEIALGRTGEADVGTTAVAEGGPGTLPGCARSFSSGVRGGTRTGVLRPTRSRLTCFPPTHSPFHNVSFCERVRSRLCPHPLAYRTSPRSPGTSEKCQ